LVDCGQELGRILDTSARNEEIIEIKDILARYSTERISSWAFGIQSNSLKDQKLNFVSVEGKYSIHQSRHQ
jgi:cytochrome P450 family 6